MNGVQVRNLFHVKSVAVDEAAFAAAGAGAIFIKEVAEKNRPNGKSAIQIWYKNPDGQVIVSDVIVKSQARAEAIEGVGTPLKKAVLSLNGSLVAGEDYIVDILIHNYQAISDNSTLTKFGAVHVALGMTTAQFMVAMAKSFALNFRRDETINKFFKFYVCAAANKDTKANWLEVKFDTIYSATYASADTLIVEEQEQPTWYRGTFPKETVRFDLAPHTVYDDGDEVQPFVVEANGLVKIEDDVIAQDTVVSIPNGYAMADLEYLCHGEIGDQLREAGYPRNIRTKYAITDADVTDMFDAIELYFYFLGRGVYNQKSEKQLTLAFKHGAAGLDLDSLMAKIGIKSEDLEARVAALEDSASYY